MPLAISPASSPASGIELSGAARRLRAGRKAGGPVSQGVPAAQNERALGLGATEFSEGSIHEAAVVELDGHHYALSVDAVEDVCDALSCDQPGRIDKFAFRSSDDVELAPLTWNFETDVFVDDEGEPLSDHDALAVRFAWTRTEGG